MKIIDRYIIGRLLRAQSFVLCTALLVLGFFTLFRSLRDLHHHANDLAQVGRVFSYSLLSRMEHPLVVALFVGALLVYQSMEGEREILVLRAAGVSYGRLFLGAILVAVLAAPVLFALRTEVAPWARMKLAKAGSPPAQPSKQGPVSSRTALAPTLSSGVYALVGTEAPDGARLLETLTLLHLERGPVGINGTSHRIAVSPRGMVILRQLLAADTETGNGWIETKRSTLHLGQVASSGGSSLEGRVFPIPLDRLEAAIVPSIVSTAARLGKNVRDLTTSALRQQIQETKGRDLFNHRRVLFESHRRSLSLLLPFIFTLLGGALGSWSRRRRLEGSALVLAAAVFFGYFLLDSMSQQLISLTRIDPLPLSLIPSIVPLLLFLHVWDHLD